MRGKIKYFFENISYFGALYIMLFMIYSHLQIFYYLINLSTKNNFFYLRLSTTLLVLIVLSVLAFIFVKKRLTIKRSIIYSVVYLTYPILIIVYSLIHNKVNKVIYDFLVDLLIVIALIGLISYHEWKKRMTNDKTKPKSMFWNLKYFKWKITFSCWQKVT